MEFLYEYGLFLAQAATLVVAVLLIAGGIFALGHRQRHEPEGHIEIRKLNDRYRDYREGMQHEILGPDELKQLHKQEKKEAKQLAKRRKKNKEPESEDKLRLYVLNFEGDMKASATDNLREEISAVLGLTRSGDEVMRWGRQERSFSPASPCSS